MDASGNVYVSDSANHKVRRIDTNGIITTFAGTGVFGFSGDGGQAVSSNLHGPDGLLFDNNQDLLIMDSGNSRIRKVTMSTGIINTIAGNGTEGYSGDGGPATLASLRGDYNMACDSFGNIYFPDSGNHRVRKVDGLTGVISTIAGNGAGNIVNGTYSGDGGDPLLAGLNFPTGVAVNASGLIYISDKSNFRVRGISGGIIDTVIGNGTQGYSGNGGLATAAKISLPTGCFFDSNNDFYFVDTGAGVIRKVSGGYITTVAGTGTSGYSGDGGPATAAQLDFAVAIAMDSVGNIYVADTLNYRVRKIFK